MRPFLLLAMLLMVTSTGIHAGFITLTYTEIVRMFLVELDKVAKANGLNDLDAKDARKLAAAWYYRWPCYGDSRKLENTDDDALSSANPAKPFFAATLGMISIFTIYDHGRAVKDSYTCRFALETAVPFTQDTR